MTFTPRIWTPIAQLLTVGNVAAVYFAAQAAEPWHAATHAALGVAFALWAGRLRARASDALPDAGMAEPDSLPHEMDQVRNELAEVQERLDFTERLLAQRHEQERMPRNG